MEYNYGPHDKENCNGDCANCPFNRCDDDKDKDDNNDDDDNDKNK